MNEIKIVSFAPADKINGKAHKDKKEFIESFTLFNLDNVAGNGQAFPEETVEIRIYRSGSTYFACVWIHRRKTDTSPGVYATGSAKGGHWDKRAAIHRALEVAGFKFEGITGELHENDAILCIAKYFDVQTFIVKNAHA